MIPCASPGAENRRYRQEIETAVGRVLESGHYILGEEVAAFEAEFAHYIGAAEGIGVASGTDALYLALLACEIGPGDEVITVSHTAVATVAAIHRTGATAVLIDVDPNFYTLDPYRLRAALTARTKAVIPVHLYGQSADLKPILEVAASRRLRVIEDCAQAHGATYDGQRVGSFGDLGCFSFYPTKNLGAIGDGGIVVTDDADLARRVRLLREYGWSRRYVSEEPGWNSRLDELQAAILRIKLRHLDMNNARRQALADSYTQLLSGSHLQLPGVREAGSHVFHLYVVRSSRRDELQDWLRRRDVAALVHYPTPVHLQPAYRQRVVLSDGLAETERAAREVLSLPMYPELSRLEVEQVATAVRAFDASDERRASVVQGSAG